MAVQVHGNHLANRRIRRCLIFQQIISSRAELRVVCSSLGVSPLKRPSRPSFSRTYLQTVSRVYSPLPAFICWRVRRRVQGQVQMVANILEIAPMRKMAALESCFPLPSFFFSHSQATNWMMGLETRIRLASMPFQRAIKPYLAITSRSRTIMALLSFDCRVCSTQKGFVASDPIQPASPEHCMMLTIELGSVCSQVFSLSYTTKQIPYASPLAITRGLSPWQKPAMPCLLMMAWALVEMEASSWLSCISILRRSMGQRMRVTTVEEEMEAARSII